MYKKKKTTAIHTKTTTKIEVSSVEWNWQDVPVLNIS